MPLPGPFHLPSEAHTDALGRALAPRLRLGDTLLLSGPLGAGKSRLARALVRARLGDPDAEVPSPTFTLVQAYEAAGPMAGPLWHADLYRIERPEEVEELGLLDALGAALCLIEWPERLGNLAPPDALRLHLSNPPGAPDAREARLDGPPAWGPRLEGLGA